MEKILYAFPIGLGLALCSMGCDPQSPKGEASVAASKPQADPNVFSEENKIDQYLANKIKRHGNIINSFKTTIELSNANIDVLYWYSKTAHSLLDQLWAEVKQKTNNPTLQKEWVLAQFIAKLQADTPLITTLINEAKDGWAIQSTKFLNELNNKWFRTNIRMTGFNSGRETAQLEDRNTYDKTGCYNKFELPVTLSNMDTLNNSVKAYGYAWARSAEHVYDGSVQVLDYKMIGYRDIGSIDSPIVYQYTSRLDNSLSWINTAPSPLSIWVKRDGPNYWFAFLINGNPAPIFSRLTNTDMQISPADISSE